MKVQEIKQKIIDMAKSNAILSVAIVDNAEAISRALEELADSEDYKKLNGDEMYQMHTLYTDTIKSEMGEEYFAKMEIIMA